MSPLPNDLLVVNRCAPKVSVLCQINSSCKFKRPVRTGHDTKHVHAWPSVELLRGSAESDTAGRCRALTRFSLMKRDTRRSAGPHYVTQ